MDNTKTWQKFLNDIPNVQRMNFTIVHPQKNVFEFILLRSFYNIIAICKYIHFIIVHSIDVKQKGIDFLSDDFKYVHCSEEECGINTNRKVFFSWWDLTDGRGKESERWRIPFRGFRGNFQCSLKRSFV